MILNPKITIINSFQEKRILKSQNDVIFQKKSFKCFKMVVSIDLETKTKCYSSCLYSKNLKSLKHFEFKFIINDSVLGHEYSILNGEKFFSTIYYNHTRNFWTTCNKRKDLE